VTESTITARSADAGTRFALTKFQSPMLPAEVVTRSALHDRLTVAAAQRLTLVVGSAGTGKSVLLSSWSAARRPALTAWLSCDDADREPVRFWTGFIEACRSLDPEFGRDAEDLLATTPAASADVIASIANDAVKLPEGSAVIVDDFHHAARNVAAAMTDLVERWPCWNVQLVLSSRFDPAVRLHRLRLSGELSEIRDRDLRFSLTESRDLLAKFGVQMAGPDLALLQQRSEGWAVAVQMAALSLRGTGDPVRIARTLDFRSHAIGEYFVCEVLSHQPPEVVEFMLDTCVLAELTSPACAAVSGRPDAAALLHRIEEANLLLVALDEERATFRYHYLVRQVLHAELRSRDRSREQALQLRAAAWYESAGDMRRAARHLLAARQVDRALDLLQERVVADFLRDPAAPVGADIGPVDPALLADSPGRLVSLATDLLLSGDIEQGEDYLDVLERMGPEIPAGSSLAARLATARSLQYFLTGRAGEAIRAAGTACDINEQHPRSDQWAAAVPMILLRAHTWLEDYEAVEREAAAALAAPAAPEPARLILVPGARSLAWFEAGQLRKAAQSAGAADAAARRLGFSGHVFAIDYLRALAGLALERRDLATAEQLTEQAMSISTRRRPAAEYLTRLDRARILAYRGQAHEALSAIEAARSVPIGIPSPLPARADELEALVRLSLGDPTAPAELAQGLPDPRRSLLLAKVAITTGDQRAAQVHLHSLGRLSPRQALIRQLLLTATAIDRHDPVTARILVGALDMARSGGFLGTVVATCPQVTSYLIEHSQQLRTDPFMASLIAAAVDARAAEPASRRDARLAEPLTVAELRVLRLLPTSNCRQLAAALYISSNTVKTHLRSVYQKLGVGSRSEAIERALDLHLLLAWPGARPGRRHGAWSWAPGDGACVSSPPRGDARRWRLCWTAVQSEPEKARHNRGGSRGR
jgi:LuxR family transcriptional regulator, maltose regulon positive regulatory protein